MRWIAASLCCASCLSKPALPDTVPACQTWGPFGAQRALDELNHVGFNEDGAWLSVNHLQLYYSSDETGDERVHRAHRDTPDGVFIPDGIVPELMKNNQPSETSPFLSDDELTIWFDSGGQIYTATRTATDPTFGGVAHVVLAGGSNDFIGTPAVTVDGGTIVFSFAASAVQPQTDLWIAHRDAPDQPFSGATRLGLSVDGQSDCCPDLSSAGDLVFATSRDNGVPAIWQAPALSDVPGTFGNPSPLALPPPPGPSDEPFLSRDGRTLLFTVTPNGGKSDLWMTERMCLD